MESIRNSKIESAVNVGLDRTLVTKYISLLEDNNIQLEDRDEVFFYGFLKYQESTPEYKEECQSSKCYQSWRNIGCSEKISAEYSIHYIQSGWVGDHQSCDYFAYVNICDSIDYYLRKKYSVDRTEEIENLLILYE